MGKPKRFLKDALAHGPKQVAAVEEAAAKAHVDPQALERARADLGIVTSRSNAGGVQAVQRSLRASIGSVRSHEPEKPGATRTR